MQHFPYTSGASLRIGTRKSQLAMAQAEILRAELLSVFPELVVEFAPMTTTGDRNTHRTLADIGGKRLFTKELEEALMNGHIDLAVHSLKDMETHLPPGLSIAAVLARDDPRDALVSRGGLTLAALPPGARIGTSSPRRAAQLKLQRPDLTVVPFRGNVNTRLAKLKEGQVDATLLALAGLKRLGLESEIAEILDTERFIPAAGQGAIAVECRKDNEPLREMLRAVRHIPTHYTTLAERSLLAAINGSCRTPIGVYARSEGGHMKLSAMIATPDGSESAFAFAEGNAEEAETLGRQAGDQLLSHGAKAWFQALMQP